MMLSIGPQIISQADNRSIPSLYRHDGTKPSNMTVTQLKETVGTFFILFFFEENFHSKTPPKTTNWHTDIFVRFAVYPCSMLCYGTHVLTPTPY